MKFTNPILWGDYSDPDVCRVGEDFYMISSSFTYVPGIPVLKSRDLVHWKTIGYAVKELPFEWYNHPKHKRGTWAPSIRYHAGKFYVTVCLPDEGLFVYTAEDPAGEWECHWVKDECGWIDPCPLFDDDGNTYLVHGFAGSRAGIKNMLFVHRMSPDGLQVLDEGRPVYLGADHGDVTVEGPKFYKRDGKYWILCPAGGVKPGYQLALRADSPFGPYERRVVLAQGNTPVNGPHQGGWVDDGHGGDWFIHFQDVYEYGRIPHLQPVDWSDGWPVMGDHGEPVAEGDTGFGENAGEDRMSDDFRGEMNIRWQWQCNPGKDWAEISGDGLRIRSDGAETLFESGTFLSQMMMARDFDMEIKVRPEGSARAGLGMIGYTYRYLEKSGGTVRLIEGTAEEHGRMYPETVTEHCLASVEADESRLVMRVRNGKYSFLIGDTPIGDETEMVAGGWTGARPGICVLGAGSAVFDYCCFTTPDGEKI